MVTRLLLTSCVLLVCPYSSFADFTGPVVSILDGDTLEVPHNQHPERIRLSRINCPEKGQAYGNNAKHAARSPWLSYTEPRSNMCPIERGGCWPTAAVRIIACPSCNPIVYRISREHPGRTLLILVRVVSVEERVPKAILFGLPSCSLKRRTCLHALPSAPFNARCDGYGCGCGCRCHGSPPLLDRTKR